MSGERDVCASCGFPWGVDPVRHAEFCDNRRSVADADAEVARIMAMSDEQILAEATPDDLAWAERFKASIRTAIATRPKEPSA